MKQEQYQLETEHKHLKIVSQYTIDILPANSEQEVIGFLSDTLLNKLDIDDFEFYSFEQPILLDLYTVPKISLGEGIIGEVASSLQAQNIDDLRQLSDNKQSKSEHLSALIVPIVSDKKLVGVIYCASKSLAAFSLQIEKSLFSIASITAIKMEKNRAKMVRLLHCHMQWTKWMMCHQMK